jgi:protein-tyrosine phosphatase
MFNLRDIGGQRARGGTIRRGLVWRSNALVDLGETGRRELSQLGIRTAIDLREPGERDAEPSDLTHFDLELHEFPLIDGATGGITIDLLEFNSWLLRERGDRLTEVIRLLNSAGALPGVYFCSSGKDRTGLITALILSSLGVGDEAVIENYTHSESVLPEEYREQALQRAIAGGMPESMSEDYRAQGLASPATVMEGTLELLDREYGGAAEFLLASGLQAAELDELRNKLLETS